MTDPVRAERAWLPIALCTFKLLSLGDALEEDATLPVWGASAPATGRTLALRLVRLGWLARPAAPNPNASL